MKLTGQRGALKIAGRTAAELGPWSFDRAQRAKKIRVHARVVRSDSFLLARAPLEIELDALNASKAVESVSVDNGSADIVVFW